MVYSIVLMNRAFKPWWVEMSIIPIFPYTMYTKCLKIKRSPYSKVMDKIPLVSKHILVPAFTKVLTSI